MSEQPQRPKGTGKVRPAHEPISALAAHAPWMPPEVSPEIVSALQACYRGDAVAGQQRSVVDWIIQTSRNDGALYFPGDAGRRDTDFALGRNFIGEMVITLLKQKLKRGGEQG